MFDSIIRFSLRNRLLVVAVAALLCAYGGFLLTKLPVDVFPDLNRPTVTIFAEAEGFAPEELEALVTFPIESAVAGAAGVRRVRSISGVGLGLVFVEFDWDTDILQARQLVTERLQQVTDRLPAGITPALGPVSSIMGEIMLVGFTAGDEEISPMELRTLVEWEVRPRLQAIAGISHVTTVGGELKRYEVAADPQRMQALGVDMETLRRAVAAAGADASGGYLLTPGREGLIRVLGRVRNAEDIGLAPLPVERGDLPPLTVADVASVREAGPPAPRGDAGVNARPGVVLSIQKQPGADTRELTSLVVAELESIRGVLPESVEIHDDLFRQAVFIERAIHNVVEALRDGSVLVVVVLFLFLLNFRTTIITLTAIPVSLLVTFIVFHRFGISINAMTLGGLAIAVGELVDDAIVDVENVMRRLRENRRLEQPRPVFKVVFRASREIRNSIVFATLLVVLVFVPLFALGGVEGRIFVPLAVAYLTAMVASLMVALTLTPVLCSWLLPRSAAVERNRVSPVVKAIHWLEGVFLHWALPRAPVVFLLALAALGASLTLVPKFGREFLPPFNEGSVTINLISAVGTSLEESNRVGRLAESMLLEVPEVVTVGRRTGRAEMDDHAQGVNSSELEVALADHGRGRDEVLADIRARLESIPGTGLNIGQPISHRIDHMLSGVRAQIAVKVFGHDLDRLRETAAAIEAVMAQVDGIVDLQTEQVSLMPQLHMRVDRGSASRLGVPPGELAAVLGAALAGEKVGEVIDGSRVHDIVVRLDDQFRGEPEVMGRLPVAVGDGVHVPLATLAELRPAMGPNMIQRDNSRRRIAVHANVSGRDLVGAVDEVREVVAREVGLPEGFSVEFGGQFESQASASRVIFWLGGVSLIAMFLLLLAHFRSAVLAGLVMLNIPFAFVGAIIGIALTGATLSIATLVGFITLTGIAARNGILMLSHYLHLMRHEGEGFTRAMIIRGTRERVIPVLMTALTAILALTPLVLGAGQPGKEILHPVALVIFCGLFTSTLLDLAVTPLVFWTFARRSVRRLVPGAGA